MHFASSRELRIMLALAYAALWSSCGGSSHSSTSSSSSGGNVQAVSVNGGPNDCSSLGKPQQALGALVDNGMLGIGFFIQDCGNACAVSGAGNPGVYYACPTSACQIIAQPGAKQVQNPVAAFSTDNNGTLLQLPSVSGSTSSANGSLIFGIGTQSNNGLGIAEVF